MRRRTRQAMSMGENEVLVLRFLIRAATRAGTVTPTDIARYLGISTASTTALIDRLEQSGHISPEAAIPPTGGASSSPPRSGPTTRCAPRWGRWITA